MSDDTYDLDKLLVNILTNKTYKDISDYINVSVGTVKRWSDIGVPKSYSFDLLKLSNIKIDYSKFSYKEKDQFFTPKETSKYCFEKSLEIIKKYDDCNEHVFIEPSAGNGSFLKLFPEDRRIGLDIEPMDDEILNKNYLEWEPPKGSKYIVLGNPPFGLRGQLALKFINHSSNFADFVCFILPQLFESDGKGVPRKRVKKYNLIYSEKLDTDFEDPTGKKIKVKCIFQIWSKFNKNSAYDIKKFHIENIEIYSLSDGGTSSTTRNKKMFNKCDIYLPSTCFGSYNMKYYNSFQELPRNKGYGIVIKKNKDENLEKFKKIDWKTISFLSTNSAYNLRSSQILELFQ